MAGLPLWDMAGGRGMGVGCSRVEDRNVSPETGGGKAHISVLRFTAFSKIPKQAIPVLTKTRWSWGSTGVLWTRAQSSGGL